MERKEKRLAIHIKEGLALFALIKLFGKKLCRKQVKVRLTFRCDNASIVSALDKGRAKNVNPSNHHKAYSESDD